MTKPRICLIYTGGTIGMVRARESNGDTVLRPAANAEEFLRLVGAEDDLAAIADVEFVPLMNKDSANMTPDDWTGIANAIHSRMGQAARVDGFVIAHGTDTLHYTASALAFAFGPNLDRPIVLTGSQALPDVAYGDARVNLLRAVRVACEDLREVVVVFGEHILRGCRARKKDERRFDAFDSPALASLGFITEDIVLSAAARTSRTPRAEASIDFRPAFASGVVQIALTPGLRPSLLMPLLGGAHCRAIVLQAFGAGNVPDEGVYAFDAFIRSATEQGIPVVIASPFGANSTLGSHYAPGLGAVAAGAIPTGDMTNAAITVKLGWLLAQVESLPAAARIAEIRRRLNENHVGEITPQN